MYFALAGFDLLTVILSLLLIGRIMGIFTDSVNDRQEWVNRLGNVAELNLLAAKANAPGNDVFTSRDVKAESIRSDAAFAAFEQKIKEVRDELNALFEDQDLSSLTCIDELELERVKMKSASEDILSLYEQGSIEKASQRMSAMDRSNAEMGVTLSDLGAILRTNQTEQLNQERAKAASVRRYEYGLIGLILAMVVGTTFYGRRLAQRMAQVDENVRQLNLTLEERVAERTARLEAILSTAVEGIITIDERGKIDSLNSAAEKLFGYVAVELIGHNVNTLMPAPYHDEHDGYLANYRQTGERKIIGIGREVVGKRKDGTTFPMELAVGEIQLADKRIFTGFVRDLTSRRRSEEIELSLGRILEESLNEIFIFDAESLYFLQVNRGARKNIGYTQEELYELTPVDIKPYFSAEQFDETIAPLRNGLTNKLVFETVHERKDGSHYNVEIHLQLTQHQGRPTFVAIILDITERKKTEESLRVQERALQAAVNGILITDPNQDDNPIVYVNPAIKEITGYSSAETLGKNCRFLQNDDRDQAALDELRSAIKEERECKVMLRNFRKDGTPFWNELTVAPIRDAHGKLINFVGIQSDVTVRKQAEQALAELNEELEERVRIRTAELEKAQRQLVHKEKLATLGQVSGGIAHEIRNPLNAVKTSAFYLLNAKNVKPEKVTEHLERIDRQVSMINNVITALCDVARMPEPMLRPFGLADCIAKILKETSMPSNIEIGVEFPDDLPMVMADEHQLPIVFRNLIRNARDAMPDGGELTVAATTDNGHVLVSVTDTGVGIAPDQLERITEPLFSTKARGMGLGLSISRAILDKNRGRMVVASELGNGSEFTVELQSASKE